MATKKAEWEEIKKASAKRFGEESVFGEGEIGSKLAVVGEAPGENEVAEGRPFVGRAGRLLDELLEESGVVRSEAYVTNVVKIRPTKEESGGRLKNRPPRVGEVREGMEILAEELRVVGPEALVLLGSQPGKALVGKTFTMASDGHEWLDSNLGIPALATYHPAYLLRLRSADKENYERTRERVIEDLRAAWERATGV